MILRNKIKKRTLVSSFMTVILTFTNGGICGEATPNCNTALMNTTVTPNLMVIQENTLPNVYKASEILTFDCFEVLNQRLEAERLEALKAAQRNAVVTKAKEYLGVPYVWGGTTPRGFDCSGLAQYVYKELGYSITRTTYTQIHDGVAVTKAELQEGDLVFFGSPVHHVGIYIGNNEFIHAPRTGDVVKISNLNSRLDYNCARRICD